MAVSRWSEPDATRRVVPRQHNMDLGLNYGWLEEAWQRTPFTMSMDHPPKPPNHLWNDISPLTEQQHVMRRMTWESGLPPAMRAFNLQLNE